MKKTALTFSFLVPLIFYITSINAQVQTKFFRPSMTTTYIKSGQNQINKIYASFKSTPMEARFDNRLVVNNELDITFPPKPIMPTVENPSEFKKLLDNYKLSVSEWEKENSRKTISKLSPIAGDIISAMFGRDDQGNLYYDKIMEAAAYSASDGQALSAAASQNSSVIYTEIAEELLKRGYITVYNVNSIKTYEQYYDELEAAQRALAAKTGKAPKPIKRTEEGWKINFDYSIYRLVWNDSVSTIFYSLAWLDSSIKDEAVRAQKKSAFDSFTFPLELVLTGSSSASASQSNDPRTYEGLLKIRRKSMEELLTELPADMQASMVSWGGKKIDDFKMRAPIFQESPVTVKLGKKEGLYYDERFFVYEIVQDKAGKAIKERRGILRASKIIDNAFIAKGESPASTFRQQGGRSLYQGNLVELNEDYGIGFYVGSLTTNFAGGINIGLETRIPTILTEKEGYGKYLRGLYLNGNLAYNTYANESLDLDNNIAFPKVSGNTLVMGVSLSRETYISKKGNFYLMPELGAAIHNATVTKLGDEELKEEDQFQISSLYINGTLGFGRHFGPMTSFIAKLGFNTSITEPSVQDLEGNDYSNQLATSQKEGSLFEYIGGGGLFSMGLRFRF